MLQNFILLENIYIGIEQEHDGCIGYFAKK